MNIQTLLSLGAVLAAVCSFNARASVAETGKAAPDFTLTDIDGQVHRLSDYQGKTVVLEWTNPECPFVRKHYESGNLPRLQKEARSQGVVWLVINSGHLGAQGDYSPAQVKAWQREHGSAPTAYLRDGDGRVGKRYEARTTPHMYVINPAGVLVYEGAIDSIRSASQADIARAQNYVTTALQAVAAGETVKPANTQPYGCSVKY